MERDTIKLLKECDSGCKMAVDSIRQVKEYAEKESLIKVLDEYDKKHRKFRDEIASQLKEYDEDGKDPEKMASAFSWITTEMKLMLKDDSQQIAKIMMDGCNMGIQSLSEYINKYTEASRESIALAKNIVKAEEAFAKELRDFM